MKELFYPAVKMLLGFAVLSGLKWEVLHGDPLAVVAAVCVAIVVVAIRKPFPKETLFYAAKIVLAWAVFGGLAWELLHGSALLVAVFACFAGIVIFIRKPYRTEEV